MMFKKLFGKKSTPVANKVEFCVSNVAYCNPDVYDILETREDIIVEDTGCNSHCEICDCHFYALVNGEVIHADTAKGLLTAIDKELAENPII